MKIDTNMILILGLGGLALFLLMKSGILSDDDKEMAMQMAAQQQMNAMQQQQFMAAIASIKQQAGMSVDDNPWDNPQTYTAIADAAAGIIGAFGSFF